MNKRILKKVIIKTGIIQLGGGWITKRTSIRYIKNRIKSMKYKSGVIGYYSQMTIIEDPR